MIRVFRAAPGDDLASVRARRSELVTFDTRDLVRVLTRCQTTFHSAEAARIREAVSRIPDGAAADIVLASDGRVVVAVREPQS